MISALRFERVAWCRTARLCFSLFYRLNRSHVDAVGPVKCRICRVSEHLPRPSFSLDSLCALFLYVNKVWEITISNMKCHDALIYPYKVLLCNSFFPHSPRVNTYPYMYCTFIFSHVAQHGYRLRCPSSLVGSCLCLILPFFLYLQKASGFRVMVAISVAHLVLFLQKIYGIHICSSIGTGYSLQIKKFHFFPYHSPSSYSHGWALAMRFHLS